MRDGPKPVRFIGLSEKLPPQPMDYLCSTKDNSATKVQGCCPHGLFPPFM